MIYREICKRVNKREMMKKEAISDEQEVEAVEEISEGRKEKERRVGISDHQTSQSNSCKEISNQDVNIVEQRKLSLMRAFVESRDPSSKEVDDLTLRRFLRARDLDVEKGGGLFLKYLKWKITFLPNNGSISEADIQNEIAQNKVFVGGMDKQGRPIMVVFGGKHFQNTIGGLDEFKRFVVYSLDKICRRMPAGQEKFTGIGDLQGWGYSNSDIRGYLGALSILQDCYPERLGKLYLVHAPRIFMTVWKIVYPFIDNKTRTKIVFVENKQLKSTLVQDIDESQLPDIYGGKLPLVPIQDV